MHDFLSSERFAVHAPGDYHAPSCWQGGDSQSHPQAPARSLQAKPEHHRNWMGCGAESPVYGRESSDGRPDARSSGLISARRKFFSSGSKAVKSLALGLIRGYQVLISPVLPRSCRFYPSCSAYAIDAIKKRGLLSGVWLSFRRLARCHPWGGHGYDPAPDE